MVIKIITDSTCDLDLSLQEDLNIDILPLTVHFGDEEFHDGIDITKKEFYDKLRESETSPTTGLAWLIYEAVSLRDKAASAEEIVQHIENAKQKIIVYAMIENLDYLKKDGRLSVVGATIGTLLNLKPFSSVIQMHQIS